MRARRLLIILATVGGFLAMPVAAHAGSGYPIDPPQSTVTNATVSAGGSVDFGGSGFLAGETIDINISYSSAPAALHVARHPVIVAAALKTVVASSSGTFSTPVSVDQTGTATLTAFGETSHVTISEQVTSVAPSTNSLAVTGAPRKHWIVELALGLGSILVGGLLMLTTVRIGNRRPRRT